MSTGQQGALWVEVTGKSGALLTRQHIAGDTFAIGRGYQNDLIVDDPYVSPAHLRLTRDEAGAWWVDDLASDNGTLDLRDHSRVGRLPLVDGAALRIGETHVRFCGAAFAVAPTLLLAPAAPAAAVAPAPTPRTTRNAIAVMLLVALISALSIWIKQTGESKIVNYIFGVVVLPVMALGWALVWALVTRIVSAHGQFFRHVLIVGLGLLAVSAIEALFKYADYAFAFIGASSWESVLLMLVLGALLTAHLRVVTPHRFRLAAGVVGALVIGTIALSVTMRNERERLQSPSIVTSLLPSFLPTKPPVSTATLFESIGALRPALEEERKKDPPQGGIAADFD
jgi:Inner membrane component of T3SS, cytoplasmic domain